MFIQGHRQRRTQFAVLLTDKPHIVLNPSRPEGRPIQGTGNGAIQVFTKHKMRSPKSRSRGKSNRNRSAGNNINRVFDSSGPEGKVRGTPQQVIDKYQQLTRDAQLANDRVAAENFLQHAEHYVRLLGEAQREADARKAEHEVQQRDRQTHRDTDRTVREGTRRADDPAGAPQPSVAGVIENFADDSGLVETPEATAAPNRSRSSRAPEAAPGATAPETSRTLEFPGATEAAE